MPCMRMMKPTTDRPWLAERGEEYLSLGEYEAIRHLLPVPRGQVTSQYLALCGMLLVIIGGLKWRLVPARYGKWQALYKRYREWVRNGVIQRVHEALSAARLERFEVPDQASIDSTSVKLTAGAHGAPRGEASTSESRVRNAIGKSRGGWNTKIHVIAIDPWSIILYRLTGGNVSDSRAGEGLLRESGPILARYVRGGDAPHVLMDRAYEGNPTRTAAREAGYEPIVPPKRNRKKPWDYDKEHYKKRSIVEQLFMNLKQRYAKIATRYDKLISMFEANLQLALSHLLLTEFGAVNLV